MTTAGDFVDDVNRLDAGGVVVVVVIIVAILVGLYMFGKYTS